MDTDRIYVKNMVCARCIATVKELFSESNIEIRSIQLGEVITNSKLNDKEKALLDNKLKAAGFQLLQDHKSTLISQVKSIIIDQVHHSEQPLKINFSSFIAEKLHHEYTSLSKLFSSIEGMTIERYILKQKIERAKELLFYDELTLTQIANQLDYSSVAHLSSQFKKETGMTPTEFKKLREPKHNALDSI